MLLLVLDPGDDHVPVASTAPSATGRAGAATAATGAASSCSAPCAAGRQVRGPAARAALAVDPNAGVWLPEPAVTSRIRAGCTAGHRGRVVVGARGGRSGSASEVGGGSATAAGTRRTEPTGECSDTASAAGHGPTNTAVSTTDGNHDAERPMPGDCPCGGTRTSGTDSSPGTRSTPTAAWSLEQQGGGHRVGRGHRHRRRPPSAACNARASRAGAADAGGDVEAVREQFGKVQATSHTPRCTSTATATRRSGGTCEATATAAPTADGEDDDEACVPGLLPHVVGGAGRAGRPVPRRPRGVAGEAESVDRHQ